MGSSYIIASAKGGVGKTTVAVNLGVALAKTGKKTILIDGSITTPDVALHMGIPFYIRTLNDFIKRDADINETVYEHPSGLKIIPTSMHPESSLEWLDTSRIKGVVDILKNEKDYFVLIDSSAGLTMTTTDVIKSADKMIVVTNPELTSAVNSYKTILAGKKLGIDTHGIIINRTGRFRNELSDGKIRHIMPELPIVGKIPEHHSVPISTENSVSVLDKYPDSPPAIEFRRIAAAITGERYYEHYKPGFWRRTFGFLRR